MEKTAHPPHPTNVPFSPGFLGGAKLAVPIMMGYFPAGFAFGVLARDIGLSFFEITLMSLITFTGSSQFVAVAQIAAGAPLWFILVTCAIVNMRYLLMSAVLATKYAHLPFFQKLLFGMELTDETFVVNCMRADKASPEELARPPLSYETLGLNTMSHGAWVLASASGAFFGGILGDVGRFGIDFGLVAIFLALLAPRLKDRKQFCVILFSGFCATAFFLLGFDTWSIVLATVAGATLGAAIP